MRTNFLGKLTLGRIRLPGYPVGDAHNGAFIIRSPTRRFLQIITSDGMGWDHVSVSVLRNPHETPTWEEMAYIKGLCFLPTETVMQLHVPDKQHINHHPGCLHLWRPQSETIPQPPASMVAPMPEPEPEPTSPHFPPSEHPKVLPK